MKTPRITKEQNQKVTQHELFTIVDREKTFIALGQTIISEQTFNNTEESIEYINKKPYELIINSCCFIMEQHLKTKDNETK